MSCGCQSDSHDDTDATRRQSRVRSRRSGARVIRLLPKRQFDYTFLDVDTSTTVTLHRALPVAMGFFYWLGLRIHNRDIGRGSFTLNLFETLPSANDPAEFSKSTPALSLSVGVGAGDAPPRLKWTTANELGPFLKVTLTASQGSGAPLQLYAELSAVLLVRPR